MSGSSWGTTALLVLHLVGGGALPREVPMNGRWLRKIHRILALSLLLIPAAGIATEAPAATGEEVQARIRRDVAAGLPVVAHVIVALCDNEHQGINPVDSRLGNGQDPPSNLYWGALYGVRSFFVREGGWTRLAVAKPADERILDRVVLRRHVEREGRRTTVFVVADAWDGAEIKAAIERFLTCAGGGAPETVRLVQGADSLSLAAGGAAHLVAYVGHDGLMEFSLEDPAQRAEGAQASSSMVLACSSRHYFLEKLRSAGSHALLLTTGLMAPEAYTLDAAIRSWAEGATPAETRAAAADAYDRYQPCGRQAALNLFWSGAP